MRRVNMMAPSCASVPSAGHDIPAAAAQRDCSISRPAVDLCYWVLGAGEYIPLGAGRARHSCPWAASGRTLTLTRRVGRRMPWLARAMETEVGSNRSACVAGATAIPSRPGTDLGGEHGHEGRVQSGPRGGGRRRGRGAPGVVHRGPRREVRKAVVGVVIQQRPRSQRPGRRCRGQQHQCHGHCPRRPRVLFTPGLLRSTAAILPASCCASPDTLRGLCARYSHARR
jgi:hypothetical protein